VELKLQLVELKLQLVELKLQLAELKLQLVGLQLWPISPSVKYQFYPHSLSTRLVSVVSDAYPVMPSFTSADLA
jgi:hypothetical protein